MYLGISLFVRPFVSSHGLMFVYSFVSVCLFVESSALPTERRSQIDNGRGYWCHFGLNGIFG